MSRKNKRKLRKQKRMAQQHYHEDFVNGLNERNTSIITVPQQIIIPEHLDKPLNLKHIPDLDMFKRYMQADFLAFKELKFELVIINNRRYLFRDNGCNILGVAHLDTVLQDKIFSVEGNRIYSPQLDDRLGVWSLLYALPTKMGYVYDILLTDDEEMGASTASLFTTAKKYNWIFEIDRADSDSVLYDYETKEYRKLLEDNGFEVGWGTFTDICELEHLGCLGINFACGYHGQHTTQCYVDTDIYTSQLDKVITFIQNHKEIHYPHDIKAANERRKYYNSIYNYHGYYSGVYAAPGWDDEGNYKGNYYNTNNTKWDKYTQNDGYSIVNCPVCDNEAFLADIYCEHCGGYLKGTACKICDDKNCVGLVKCKICQFSFHDDIYIFDIGVCRDCLTVFYKIDSKLLDSLEVAKYLDNQTTDVAQLIINEMEVA